MPEREDYRELRGAVARGDGAGLIRILSAAAWPPDALQLIGDGLLVALRQRSAGADEGARRCVELLRARGWEGDDELVQALRARLGEAAAPMLRPLAVDLGVLTTILEGDPVRGGGRIDLISGDVWPQSALDDSDDVDEDDDPQRWLWVDCQGSRPAYRDMECFIADLNDPEAAVPLSRAIIGRGAFRRFGDTLSASPDLLTRWKIFSDERRRGRARAWLAAAGYAAVPARLGTPRG